MLKFDPAQLNIEFVRLKTVSTVLGGSISIIDENLSTPKKEVTKRVKVPLAVARGFIQKTKKITKYLKPTWVAMAKYGDHVVAMERHPLASMGALIENGNKWVPMMESLLKGRVLPSIRNITCQWYFDGRYVYHFGCGEQNLRNTVGRGKPLTSNGQFHAVPTYAIDLQMLDDKDGLNITERSSLGFISNRDPSVFNVSPPIWKNLANVGMTKLRGGGVDDDDEGEIEADEGGEKIEFIFDEIDRRLAVNLNFALKAGQEIGKTFGYEFIEPLHLARLMIELRTVNLPNLPKQIKATYDINLKFTHSLAWLLGLQRKATTLETLLMVRSLMKHLTKKGLFKSDVFQEENVFQPGKSFDNLQTATLEELLADKDKMSTISEAISAALAEKAAKKRGGRSDEDEENFE